MSAVAAVHEIGPAPDTAKRGECIACRQRTVRGRKLVAA